MTCTVLCPSWAVSVVCSEGFATSELMCDFAYNLNAVYFQGNDTMRSEAVQFLVMNYDWVMSRTQVNGSLYWSQVRRGGLCPQHVGTRTATLATIAGCISTEPCHLVCVRGCPSETSSPSMCAYADVVAWCPRPCPRVCQRLALSFSVSLFFQVAAQYAQVEGLSAGQTYAKASCAMAVSDVLVVNGQGDLGDIAMALFPSLRVPWDTLRCAIVRASPPPIAHRPSPTAHPTATRLICVWDDGRLCLCAMTAACTHVCVMITVACA